MSLTFGISSSGFIMPDYNAYNNDITQSLIAQIPNIDLTSGSVNSIILELFINSSYQLLEAVENLYYQLFPATATGVNLDRLVAFANLIRINATYTTVQMVFTGANGTFVPSKTIVQDTDNQFQFQNSTAFTLLPNECYNVSISIQIVNGQDYDLSINGIYIGVKNVPSITIANLLLQIENNFINNQFNNLIFSVQNNNIIIQSNDISNVFSVSLNSSVFTIASISAVKTFTCTKIGQISVNANVLNQLSVPVFGIESVNNPLSALPGTNVETDIQLRQRFFNIGRNSRNYATFSAIISTFQNANLIQGISYVNLIENRTNTTDSNSLPPHSICLIILGGDNISIANLLWQVAPAGIGFYGNTSISITDSLGNAQMISFTRPVSVYIFIKIKTYTQNNLTLSSSDYQNILNNVMNYGNSLKPGQNVIVNLISAYTMLGASSILNNVDIQIGTSTSSNITPVTFASTDINISLTQMAIFNESNVSFV